MRDNNKKLLQRYIIEKDEDAYKLLMENNLSLVQYIIKKTVYKDILDKEDAYEFIGVGCIGLSNAIKSFDINKIDEISFSTYASKCIRTSILGYLASEKRPQYLDWQEKVIHGTSLIRLDELIPDDSEIPYEEIDFDNYKKKKVKEALLTLNPRDRMIIEMNFGLNGNPKLPQREIAERLNISLTYVSRIIATTYCELRKSLNEFKEYYSGRDEELMRLGIEERKLDPVIANCGQEQLNQILASFNPKIAKCIYLYYGLNGYKKTPISEMSQILGFTSNTLVAYVSRYTNLLKKCIKNPSIIKTKSKEDVFLQNMYYLYGEDMVNIHINRLNDRECEIFKLYYGIDSNGKYEPAHIAILLGLNTQYVNSIIKIAQSQLKKRLNYLDFNDEGINQLFNKYGEENVKNLVDTLSLEQQYIFKSYYGIEKEPTDITQIAKDLNVSKTKVRKQLTNIKQNIIHHASEEYIDISNNIFFGNEEKLFEIRTRRLYAMLDADINVLTQAKKILTFNEKRLIDAYYGIDDNTILSLYYISRKLKIRVKDIDTAIVKIIYKIKDSKYLSNIEKKGNNNGK